MLETCRANFQPEHVNSDGNEGDDGSDDSEGMATRLDRILEGPPQADVVVPRTGAPKGHRVGPAMASGGSPLCAILAPTPLPCLHKVGPSPTPTSSRV